MAAPSSSGVPEADLRLAALALIAEAPRHGYEIIKLLEEKTADWYLPSPNTVHPMLANLAEAGYLTASPAPRGFTRSPKTAAPFSSRTAILPMPSSTA